MENQAATSQDEKALLVEQAKQLGITHSPNIGLDTLREKIRARLADEPDKAEPAAAGEKEETPEEQARRIRNELQASALKLVRLRITNMDPSKASLHGEILSVENSYLGTIRKFIPFGDASEVGYHVPHILYELLKEKKFNQIKTRKGRNPGEILIEQRMVPEYALEVLPPLTEQELADLKASQAAKAGLQD